MLPPVTSSRLGPTPMTPPPPPNFQTLVQFPGGPPECFTPPPASSGQNLIWQKHEGHTLGLSGD